MRWADQGAGRKMLQGARVILKGRVQVGLGQIAGVACLGEQGEVGQGQPGREGPVRRGGVLGAVGRNPGVDEGAQEQ